MLQADDGEIQVIHATPAQVEELRKTHDVKIIEGEGANLMVRLYRLYEAVMLLK